MRPLEDVVVGAADPHPERADQDLVGAASRCGPLLEPQLAGLDANEGVHCQHDDACPARG